MLQRITSTKIPVRRAAKTFKGVAGGVYTLVDTKPLWEDLLHELMIQPSFAGDTETTGKFWCKHDVVGYSFSWGATNSYYVPIRHETDEKQLKVRDVHEGLKSVFARKNLKTIWHNAKFDLHFLIKYGMKPKGLVHDTLILYKLLDEISSAALKDLAVHFIDSRANMWEKAIEDFRTKKGREKIPAPTKTNPNKKAMRKKANVHYGMVPLDIMTPYAASDAHYTWILFKEFFTQVAEDTDLRQLYIMENQLLWVLLYMEHHGVFIDIDYLKHKGPELAAEIQKQEAFIRKKLQSPDCNIASNPQLIEALTNLGITWNKKTPKNKPSLDSEVLENLAIKYPICQNIRDFRLATKLKSTYVDNIQDKISSIDGRLHCSYNQNVSTGRMCIAEGTLILMPCRPKEYPNGTPIEQVKKGQMVYSYTPNGDLVIRKVLWAGSTGNSVVHRLRWQRTDSDLTGELLLTARHEVMMETGKWKKAQRLKPGDLIRSLYIGESEHFKHLHFKRKPHKVLSIERFEFRNVYDLEIEDTKSYIANELCVHNSSKEPNLQNIPSRDKTIRRAFHCPPSFVITPIDLSQIEVRLAAHFSQEPVLMRAYTQKPYRDAHTNTMCEVFGYDYDEAVAILNDDQQPLYEELQILRKIAKQINFLIIYGGGANTLKKNISTPKKQFTKRQCQTYIDRYFARMRGLKRWINSVKAQVRKQGYLQNYFGRYRRFPELQRLLQNPTLNKYGIARIERQATNFIIQSSAADLFKNIMVRVGNYLMGKKSKLVMTIHDEIIIYTHRSELNILSDVVDLMEDWNFSVPIIADVSYSDKSWADKKEL